MSNKEEKKIDEASAKISLGKPILLIVDDDKDSMQALERVLRSDFTILKSATPSEAFALLQTAPDVAIVLSDYQMPGENGIEFLERVKLIAPLAVRALISGQVELSQMMLAINDNVIHRFILKPWDNDYLRLQMLETLKNYYIIREKNHLEKLSITDPVTELFNHRFFQDALKRELERSTRHRRSLSLMMIDIDHFKDVNDQFGHPEGDRILNAISKRLSFQVRNLDIVCRYGGEEFAIIMPDTSLDLASKVAERIRTAFATKQFTTTTGIHLNITLSLGVAAFPEHALTPENLIKVADESLYKAKSLGRNRSVVALQD